MDYELFEKTLSSYYNSNDIIHNLDVNNLDEFQFIKLKMFKLDLEIRGSEKITDINKLYSIIIKGKNISKKDYAVRSLELKQIYQKYSLDVYFSDNFEIDLAIYQYLIARYYLNKNQKNKDHNYFVASKRLFQIRFKPIRIHNPIISNS